MKKMIVAACAAAALAGSALAADGKRVVQAASEANLKCTVPELKDGVFFMNTAPGAPITAKGTFTSVENFQSAVPFGAGNVGKAHSVVTGRFGANGAAGTWKMTVDVLDATTKESKGSCTTGTLRWSAAL